MDTSAGVVIFLVVACIVTLLSCSSANLFILGLSERKSDRNFQPKETQRSILLSVLFLLVGAALMVGSLVLMLQD